MIYKSHHIELYINGKSVEFENQGDVDIRFNNVLFDPTKISSNQAEYSFEFELPCTPTNNKIFEHANNLSKLNKFHARYDGELYADGTLIFKGSVTLNSVSNKHYSINLVSIKTNSLEDIFGEATMNEIPWDIDFEGASSINEYNADPNSNVTFPLVSYGVFQKVPYYQDKVAKDYTSVYDIDKYNIWYQDTFAPSLNMLELMKKAFEWKGYTVVGDAMNDYFLKDIFCSASIASDQEPIYNLGNPKFGKATLHTEWRNPKDTSDKMYGKTQDIKFKYFPHPDNAYVQETGGRYAWTKIKVWDMLNSDEGGNVTVGEDSYMYQPNENTIVIPADGFYEITLDVEAKLDQTDVFQAVQFYLSPKIMVGGYNVRYENEDVPPDFKITCPLEIQLVKNYDDNIELIHGPFYTRLKWGPFTDYWFNPNVEMAYNYEFQTSLYPHEKIGQLLGEPFADTSHFKDNGVNYVLPLDSDNPNLTYYTYGSSNRILAYDPYINPNFLCGFTTIGNKTQGGCASVIKNGYSWCSLNSNRSDSIYRSYPYLRMDLINNSQIVTSPTNPPYQENTYPNSPWNTFSLIGNTMKGKIHCLVKLNANDKIKLFGIQRKYELLGGEPVTYATSASVDLTIKAVTNHNYEYIREHEIGYGDVVFSDKLRVTNWQNKETKVSEWIQNVCDAYNIKLEQNGKIVSLNLNKLNTIIDNPSAIDVDDRVNAEGEDVESEMIDYPRSMAVKYKINTDEHGFYDSVPAEYHEQEDWEDYGDYGYDEIMLNDDSYVTKKNDKNLQFSYTWYDDFYYFGKDHERKDKTPYTTLNIPVISKRQYMIDHSKMQDKAMLRDSFSLAQRFWYRPTAFKDENQNMLSVVTDMGETIYLYGTKNYKDELNLSYKLSEKSLLKQYFNISAHLSSNFVNLEVYLTPEEYNRIKNGAYVRFDSDLYKVCSVEGYDPSGSEPTELKLMKKVVS